METLMLQIKPQTQQSLKPQLMSSVLFSKLRPAYFFSTPCRLRPFCTITNSLTQQSLKVAEESSASSSESGAVKTRASSSKVTAAAQLKENWLESLTYPFNGDVKIQKCLNSGDGIGGEDLAWSNAGFSWVIGVDPDVSGALALLKIDESGCSAQVFDSPHLQVMVGKRIRKRLDVKSMVQLLRGFDLPIGTTAYVEQSLPFPRDGKQGWWSGGFNYGLWIGVLVASGFSVVPVPSLTWKNEFELSGGKNTKDDSRRLASELFPALSSLLNRKKDHGRAEALLIAAYGKGCMVKSAPSHVLEELPLT